MVEALRTRLGKGGSYLAISSRCARRLEEEVINGLKKLAFSESDTDYRISEFKCKDGAWEFKYYDRFRAMELLLNLAQSAAGGRDSSGLREALERGARALSEHPPATLPDNGTL